MRFFKENLIKPTNFFYLILIILAILFPVSYYPRIYGTDGFQILWMAQALKAGALFSKNTWLISPYSYFGFYPFSHRAIGVPIFIALLYSTLNLFSLGYPGVILIYDIILILITYKTARNLSKILFDEEWMRFMFVLSVVLSPFVIYRTTMDVDTRIIITIIMMVLLKINLQLLQNDMTANQKRMAVLKIGLLLFIGALSHGLWIALLSTVFLNLFVLIMIKYLKLLRISLFLLLPLSIIAFFVGINIFGVDSSKIWSPFFDNSTFVGIITNLSIHYSLQIGMVIIFFPFGLLFSLRKMILVSKDSNKIKESNKISQNFKKNYFIILYIFIFSFLGVSYYTIVVALPIAAYYCVKGIKDLMDYLKNWSKIIYPLSASIILSISLFFLLLYNNLIQMVNYWYVFVVLIIIGLIFFIIFAFKKINHTISKSFINSLNFQRILIVFVLSSAILIFMLTTVEGRLRTVDSSSLPWEDRYLTNEEIEIIHFFDSQKIDGLIFTSAGSLVAERLAGAGFLPCFFNQTSDGKSIYYGFVSSSLVEKYTVFQPVLSKLTFFSLTDYNVKYPMRDLARLILNFNVSISNNIDLLHILNIQYIISINPNYLTNYNNTQPLLIKSLPNSLEPIFTTEHFIVWKIY